MKNRDENYVSITGLKKAEVLMELYNAAKKQDGPSSIRNNDCGFMTLRQAKNLLKQKVIFVWQNNRQLELNFLSKDLDVRDYNAANGSGLAQKVIDQLRWNKKYRLYK